MNSSPTVITAREERLGFWWAVAVAWIAFQGIFDAPFYSVAFRLPEGEAWLGWLKSWFFQGVGLVLVGQALWNQVSKRRFGATRLVFSTLPARLGDHVSTVLTIPRVPATPLGGPTVTLVCVETTHRNRRVPTEKLLHNKALESQYSSQEDGLSELLIEFDIPRSKPPTRHRGSHSARTTSIEWRLAVHLAFPGMDFRRTYRFPVGPLDDPARSS